MKKILTIVGTVVALLACLVICVFGVFRMWCGIQVARTFEELAGPPVEPLAFEKATWDTTKDTQDMANPKHRMALFLVEQRVLIGKPETEVRQMLGVPMYTIDDHPTNGARQLQYGVGPSSSLTGLSFHALFVELTAPSGVVTQATIGQRNI